MESTLEAAFGVEQSVDIVDEHGVDDQAAHGETEDADSNSEWSQHLKHV